MKILKNDRCVYVNNEDSKIMMISSVNELTVISKSCGVSIDISESDHVVIQAANSMPLTQGFRYSVINSIVKEVII